MRRIDDTRPSVDVESCESANVRLHRESGSPKPTKPFTRQLSGTPSPSPSPSPSTPPFSGVIRLPSPHSFVRSGSRFGEGDPANAQAGKSTPRSAHNVESVDCGDLPVRCSPPLVSGSAPVQAARSDPILDRIQVRAGITHWPSTIYHLPSSLLVSRGASDAFSFALLCVTFLLRRPLGGSPGTRSSTRNLDFDRDQS
jgi:hypothetical protein